ncbi:MAG: hypothetical protein P1U81_18940, partial [Verrucomicrobiales bacterium]|nr:hypothetical protein [Verrucomicrobiales bacterium]
TITTRSAPARMVRRFPASAFRFSKMAGSTGDAPRFGKRRSIRNSQILSSSGNISTSFARQRSSTTPGSPPGSGSPSPKRVLQIAKDRDAALAEQIERGASAPIVRVDNRRLVVTREIGVVQALRRFQAAAIELSLFYREDETASPIIASRFQVPGAFPAPPAPDHSTLAADLSRAIALRPGIRRLDLLLEKK